MAWPVNSELRVPLPVGAPGVRVGPRPFISSPEHTTGRPTQDLMQPPIVSIPENLWNGFALQLHRNPDPIFVVLAAALAIETLFDLWSEWPLVVQLGIAVTAFACGYILERDGCRGGGPVVYIASILVFCCYAARPAQPGRTWPERVSLRLRWNALPAALLVLGWVVTGWCLQ